MFFRNNTGGAEWLLVGLGNPGTQYENTRHNVGFLVADELAERQNAPIQRLKFKALTNLLTISGEKVLVMKPVTYMNLSGEQCARRWISIRSRRSGCWWCRTTPPWRWAAAHPQGGQRRRTQRPEEHHPAPGTDQFPRVRWVWEKSPTPTMTWRTGCWANSRGRTRKPSTGR